MRGAVSFRRLLGGGENRFADRARKPDEREELRGIEIILTRLVDDSDLSVPGSILIGKDLIHLPPLQGGFIPLVAQTQSELTFPSGHVNKITLDLEFALSYTGGFVPA